MSDTMNSAHANADSQEVESLQEGEQRHVLTEGELRGLKRELRQLQRKAEGRL